MVIVPKKTIVNGRFYESEGVKQGSNKTYHFKIEVKSVRKPHHFCIS